MINRLIKFYQRSSSNLSTHHIWDGVLASYQKPLIEALEKGEESEVKRLLDNAGNTDLILGLDNHGVVQWNDDMALNYIRLLAQRCGVLHAHNPEQPTDESFISHADREAIILKIEDVLPVKFSCPDVLGFKCFGATGGFPHRFPNYCAALFSISLLTSKEPPSRILEIGAGVGLLAMLCYRWGTKSYSIIDIPSTAVISAYAISQVCSPSEVWLSGEEWNANAYCRIYPSTNYKDAACSNYDLVFNSDSFPEIPIEQQDNYLQLIATNLQATGFFLSINHESNADGQRSVHDAVESQGVLELKSRAPFWLRQGYVESVYSI
jgi:hypothetical protein